MNKLMLVGGAVILAASLIFTAARNSEFDAGYEIYRTTASDTITDTGFIAQLRTVISQIREPIRSQVGRNSIAVGSTTERLKVCKSQVLLT